MQTMAFHLAYLHCNTKHFMNSSNAQQKNGALRAYNSNDAEYLRRSFIEIVYVFCTLTDGYATIR